VNFNSDNPDSIFRIFNSEGKLIQRGITNDNQIKLANKGLNIIQIYWEDKWFTSKVISMGNSR